MSIGAVGSVTPNYSPQKAGGDNVAQLEKQVEALNKQLRDIKQNDKLDPEKKEKQVRDIEKKIAEIEKKIAQMKKGDNASEQKQVENGGKKDISKEKPPNNHILDEYV